MAFANDALEALFRIARLPVSPLMSSTEDPLLDSSEPKASPDLLRCRLVSQAGHADAHREVPLRPALGPLKEEFGGSLDVADVVGHAGAFAAYRDGRAEPMESH